MTALRQVVLLAGDLDVALEQLRDRLGLNPGVRDVAGMAALGFEHEVLAIDDTFVEVVAPLTSDSSPGRLLARRGECGYMVVVQVPSLDAVCERAAALDIAPIMHTTYGGHPISQWHPRDLGTLAEIDEVPAQAPWHMCPALSDTGSTAVACDIAGVVVATADPAAMARRWATLLDVAADGTTVRLGKRSVEFVADGDGRVGLVEVRLDPSGGAAIDFTACGVHFA